MKRPVLFVVFIVAVCFDHNGHLQAKSYLKDTQNVV
jgi:hypothetical protein